MMYLGSSMFFTNIPMVLVSVPENTVFRSAGICAVLMLKYTWKRNLRRGAFS